MKKLINKIGNVFTFAYIMLLLFALWVLQLFSKKSERYFDDY